ncbi:Multifunctional alkaline phosphatase superfamily protein [Nocardioides aquaticus]|uniref:Multifunctional alkaline phosphatase superfamily protein n=1 Tax=Nocardioides aquaticus TaxID=160826 RepID=A0ABX8EH26_9ACTN|nr:Multifunctional alkaline phosphatase superfamily protein [Nocardioides aquaticus]
MTLAAGRDDVCGAAGPTVGYTWAVTAPRTTRWSVSLLVCLVLSACAPAGAARDRLPDPGDRDPRPLEPVTTPAPELTPPPGPETGRATVARGGGRPNVVVVMADDMRVDDLDFAPNVRRLVGREGLTYENSFSPYPLCCPARASFLTGAYAHNHGVYWHEAPEGYSVFDDSRTLATSLRRAGYHTGFVGKYLNGYGPMRSKVSGRPSYTYVPKGWTDWVGAFEDPDVPGIHGGTYYYWDTPYNVNGRTDNTHQGEYQTNTIGDFSRTLVRNYHRAGGPFFLNVNFVAPHHGGPPERDDPRGDAFRTPARPDRVRGMYDRLVTRPSGLARRGVAEDVSDKPGFFSRLPRVGANARRALTEVTRQRAEAVHVLDEQVGRLVRELKATGEWRDTVFVFTSDNGYFLGEHRKLTGKVLPHEPSLRVPLLVTGPGLRQGERRYDPISTVDLTATILDVAGARPPTAADGTSRWDAMRRGDQGWSVPVLTESTHTSGRPGRDRRWFPAGERRTGLGLRVPQYAFHRYRDGAGELYDLRADPAQLENRFDDPALADVRAVLEGTLRDLKDCKGKTCRTPMPEELRATPQQARELGERYWSVIDRLYGR